jgi:predicted transglutaminase-like cysteine proteinase
MRKKIMAIDIVRVEAASLPSAKSGFPRFMTAMFAIAAAMSLSACTTVPSSSLAMRDGGLTMPPAGWIDFCGRNAGDPSCRVAMADDNPGNKNAPIQISLR